MPNPVLPAGPAPTHVIGATGATRAASALGAAHTMQLSACTGVRLRALTRMVTRHYDAHLSPSGLRLTQYSLLSFLRSSGELTHSVLAQRLGMDRTTLTRNLKPLVEAGCIAQRRSAADARSSLLGITDAGVAQWQLARPQWRVAQKSLAALLGEARVAGLHGVLDECMACFEPEDAAGPVDADP